MALNAVLPPSQGADMNELRRRLAVLERARGGSGVERFPVTRNTDSTRLAFAGRVKSGDRTVSTGLDVETALAPQYGQRVIAWVAGTGSSTPPTDPDWKMVRVNNLGSGAAGDALGSQSVVTGVTSVKTQLPIEFRDPLTTDDDWSTFFTASAAGIDVVSTLVRSQFSVTASPDYGFSVRLASAPRVGGGGSVTGGVTASIPAMPNASTRTGRLYFAWVHDLPTGPDGFETWDQPQWFLVDVKSKRSPSADLATDYAEVRAPFEFYGTPEEAAPSPSWWPSGARWVWRVDGSNVAHG
jgi:hypothetical protein